MVVTGSSGGVGRACVETLTSEGHRVLGLDLAPPASPIDGADCHVEDVRDMDRFTTRLASATQLSGFVACAALSTDHSDPTDIIETNFVTAVDNLLHFIARAPPGASALLVSSVAAFRFPYRAPRGGPGGKAGARDWAESALRANPVANGYEAYCLSKRLLYECLPRLAGSAAERGTRVNCLLLGPTESPLADALRLSEPEKWDKLAAECPLGAPIPMSEATNAVSFLLSPRMAHLTGTNVFLDGGWSLPQPAVPRRSDR